ncbi:MAG: cysteine desulfurase, partial [Lachnospiraceae bacterium]|nr:cysteine desulfurase [Candidatus Minthocola equi]
MNKTVYLDNSATTQVFPKVADYMAHLMKDIYGNPSSMHFVGLDAEQELKKAKKVFCDILHAKENEIYFTAGGTESNNMSIIGTARAKCRAGKHIITTAIEHPSVLNTMQYLEDEGYEVTYLQPDSEGMITTEQVKEALREDTILVSTMMVNNEIGSRLPVEEIGRMLKETAPQVTYHVDCVQGFGKYRIRPERAGIDLLSVSGHKIHGPKGIGLLYVRNGVKIQPIIFGGGQQSGLRSGTENIPGIAGMAMAADMIYKNFDEEIARLSALKERLREGLSGSSGVSFIGPKKGGAPHIVSA